MAIFVWVVFSREDILHSLGNNKVNFIYLARLFAIFALSREDILHSLRNNKVNFIYLARLLLSLRCRAKILAARHKNK